MDEGMGSDLVPSASFGPDQIRVSQHPRADDKKASWHVVATEYGQDLRRPAGVRSVIKRQRHHVVGPGAGANGRTREVEHGTRGPEAGKRASPHTGRAGVTNRVVSITIKEQPGADNEQHQRYKCPMGARLAPSLAMDRNASVLHLARLSPPHYEASDPPYLNRPGVVPKRPGAVPEAPGAVDERAAAAAECPGRVAAAPVPVPCVWRLTIGKPERAAVAVPVVAAPLRGVVANPVPRMSVTAAAPAIVGEGNGTSARKAGCRAAGLGDGVIVTPAPVCL